MPEFLFHCAKCGQALKAETEHTGAIVLCPMCENKFAIPRFRPQLLRTGAENGHAEASATQQPAVPIPPAKSKPKTAKVFKVVRRSPTAGINALPSEPTSSPSSKGAVGNAVVAESLTSRAREATGAAAPQRNDSPFHPGLQHALPAIKKGMRSVLTCTTRLEAWLNGTPT